jgi:hypothetical protein
MGVRRGINGVDVVPMGMATHIQPRCAPCRGSRPMRIARIGKETGLKPDNQGYTGTEAENVSARAPALSLISLCPPRSFRRRVVARQRTRGMYSVMPDAAPPNPQETTD